MEVLKVLRMNAGDGKTSYANNSGVQEFAIRKSRPILDETIKEMYRDGGLPKCFKMVDLGCSSGPNTLLAVSHVINSVEEMYRKNNYGFPEFEVFLNDLPDNDFNNLFKLLPAFYEKLGQGKDGKTTKCFIYGLPGSFYHRLFPCQSLDFAYSSYSLQWLSQVPNGLENNRENIFLTKESPPDVFHSYARQYQRDFSTFLTLRAQELVHGGSMVLMLVGRKFADPASCDEDYKRVTMVAESLVDMVNEGLVNKTDLYSFNLPTFLPYKDEVKTIILKEGSFSLNKLEVFENNWDHNLDDNQSDKHRSAKAVADHVRAFLEPLIVSYFGSAINIDDLFARYTQKAAKYMLSREKPSGSFLVASLKKI